MKFKKLVSPEYAEIFSLHPGEAYALQNLTRTDRLSLVLSGKVINILHGFNIQQNLNFLDLGTGCIRWNHLAHN